jgi:sulfur-oxidizing protein SoxY
MERRTVTQRHRSHSSRREVVAGGLALVMAPAAGVLPALADANEMKREIARLVGKAGVKVGRVKVVMPQLTENGNSTSLSVTVESPMTAKDHVKAVHILSEKNPVSYIARLGIGPHAGKAQVATSIRVADSQTIMVLAEMSDGSFWSGTAATEVTTPACVDDSDRPR